jgi:hypothetical protein
MFLNLSRTITIFIFLSFWIGLTDAAESADADAGAQANWIPAKIETLYKEDPTGFKFPIGSMIYFDNGVKLSSDLIEMKYLGQLTAPTKVPFIIWSARDCTECDMNISIYIHSPTGGRILKETPRYSFPGKLFDYESPALLEESRMFFGQCLPQFGASVIWFMKTKQEDGGWQQSVFLAEVTGDHITNQELKPPLPTPKDVAAQLKKHQCIEVPGIKQFAEP